MHTGVKLVDALNINRANILSWSDSNAIRDALNWDVWMPLKNSSTVAQYVIDSLSVVEYGSGSYISLTSYIYKNSLQLLIVRYSRKLASDSSLRSAPACCSWGLLEKGPVAIKNICAKNSYGEIYCSDKFSYSAQMGPVEF